jgi:hypothetical protein
VKDSQPKTARNRTGTANIHIVVSSNSSQSRVVHQMRF